MEYESRVYVAAGAFAFPPGCKYVRIGMLINNGGAATATIDVDRLIFRRKVDAKDTRSIDGSSVGRDSDSDKRLPTGITADDGATFLGITKGVEVWEAEHSQTITFVGGPYQDIPIIRVLGGLGWQPESKWGTRIQANLDTAADPANTAVAHWPLKRGESVTVSSALIAALLEELKVTLTARTVTLLGANLTAVGASTTTDLPANLPANNDEFRFDYDTRVKICVHTSKTPDWAIIEMTVTCELDDGGGWDIVATNVYSTEADGLGNCSDSGTINRTRTVTWPGMKG